MQRAKWIAVSSPQHAVGCRQIFLDHVAAKVRIASQTSSNMAPRVPDKFASVLSHVGIVATECSAKKDQEIYGEGEPAEFIYQVVCGGTRSYKLLSDGRRQIGAFHLPGDVLGLETGKFHRFTTEALIDTTVRLVKRCNLDRAAKVNVRVARDLWFLTVGDLRHAEDHILLLGCKTAIEKMASFLLEMDRRLPNTGMFALPMCRRDIGDYLGLTFETVSRTLSKLHDQGMVEFHGARQVILSNHHRLRKLDA